VIFPPSRHLSSHSHITPLLLIRVKYVQIREVSFFCAASALTATIEIERIVIDHTCMSFPRSGESHSFDIGCLETRQRHAVEGGTTALIGSSAAVDIKATIED
jgi:hypothetical protein